MPAGLDSAAAAIVLGGGWWYVWAMGRHRARRGVLWPHVRAGCFVAGLAAIALATQGPLEARDSTSFAAHSLQHVLLGLVAPLLLAAGAPVTLWLRAGGAGPRPAGPAARLVLHPLVVTVAFVSTLPLLYATPLAEAALRHPAVHVAVHVHLVAAGFAWAWVLIGPDPVPCRWSYGGRALLVAASLPLHGLVAAGLLSSNRLIAGGWYRSVTDAGDAELLARQHTGLQLMWGAGELVGVAALIVLVVAWMHADERRNALLDEAGDATSDRWPVAT